MNSANTKRPELSQGARRGKAQQRLNELARKQSSSQHGGTVSASMAAGGDALYDVARRCVWIREASTASVHAECVARLREDPGKRMTKLRRATPEEGRVLWQVIEQKGGKPGARAVARAFNASGAYYKVHASTVHRWQTAGWKRAEKFVKGRKPVTEDDAAKAATGDPVATFADIKRAIESVIGKAEIQRLCSPEVSRDALLAEFEREHIASLIVAQRLALYRMAKSIDNTEMLDKALTVFSTLARGLAGSLLDMAVSDKTRKETAPAPGADAIGRDELDPVWETFRKAIAEEAA